MFCDDPLCERNYRQLVPHSLGKNITGNFNSGLSLSVGTKFR
jgi:hypothetical protein